MWSAYLRYWLQPQRLAIVEACLIGLVSGLAAVTLQQGIGLLGTWRLSWTLHVPAPLVLALIGSLSGFTSGWLIERFAPEAAGSGIPQVKAALAQYPTRLDLRVAGVKLISVILALGGGLTLGRQGPTVQIGAALASQFSRWFPTAPNHRKQMIAAGAGAGLAAAFNAPLAGVLFIVEELLRDLSGLTLGTAILSSFIGAVVARVLGGYSLSANLSDMTAQTGFSLAEIPFYILLGGLAGLFGGLFNRGLIASLDFYQRLKGIPLPWRMAIAGLCCGTALGFLPGAFQNNAGLRHWISMGSADWHVIVLVFVVQFCLTLVAFGSGAPGGIFAPSLILGASLGQMVGILATTLLGTGLPTTFALVGMGAFFGAVSRVPFTGIVIIFEMTTDFNLVLPLMISGVMAYLAAEQVSSGSIYSRLLARQGIQLDPTPKAPGQGPLAQLTAAELMQRRVETLPSSLSVAQAKQAFAKSHHRGFPVLEAGKLVGILTQTDLSTVSQQQLPDSSSIREVMTPQPLSVRPSDTLSDVLYTLDRYKISRLPVVEGRRLIGIITRADIIQAESQALGGATGHMGPHPDPSYCVYQTRGPTTGKGRLLIPLANPNTAEVLLRVGATLARDRQFELECLKIVIIPRNLKTQETSVRTGPGRELLRQAVRTGQQYQVSVHTQIRVAHDVAQTILEVEKQRHIDLILMGWQGHRPTANLLFGDTVDTIMRQSASPVLLLKWPNLGQLTTLKRWLIPMSGGPNVAQALTLLPPLIRSFGPESDIFLCQVQPPEQPIPRQTLHPYSVQLEPHCGGHVKEVYLSDSSVADAILNFAQSEAIDVIVVGASRQGLFDQVLKGSIPEAIARNSNCAVLLLRGSTMAEDGVLDDEPKI